MILLIINCLLVSELNPSIEERDNKCKSLLDLNAFLFCIQNKIPCKNIYVK